MGLQLLDIVTHKVLSAQDHRRIGLSLGSYCGKKTLTKLQMSESLNTFHEHRPQLLDEPNEERKRSG
jgi:hypothetical protein